MTFDKKVQSAKRCFWASQQQNILTMYRSDTRQFWKKIGQIGAGSDRSNQIPREIILDDGSISSDPNSVLNKWKQDVQGLLNPGAMSHTEVNAKQISLNIDPATYCIPDMQFR